MKSYLVPWYTLDMSRKPLEPGESSIGTATPTRVETTKNGRTVTSWRLKWRYRPHPDPATPDVAMPVRVLTTRANSRQEVVAKAKVRHAQLNDEHEQRVIAYKRQRAGVVWSKKDSLPQFITEVTAARIADATKTPKISERTRKRYLTCTKYLAEAFDGKAIEDITDENLRPIATVIDAIESIAPAHGRENARQCRNVLSGYVVSDLQIEGLMSALTNPFSKKNGLRFNYGDHKASNKPSGGIALSERHYDAVLAYLLGDNAESYARTTNRGGTPVEATIQRRQAVVDLTLLQATTGIRVNEACQLRCSDLLDDANGNLVVVVRKEISKGGLSHGRRRDVAVLNDAVADHLRTRLRSRRPTDFFISTPTDPQRQWDFGNRNKAIRALYREMSSELGIESLHTDFRSHGWRTTLNMIYYDTIPDDQRATWFGHSVDVNHANYTPDDVDTMAASRTAMLAATRKRQQDADSSRHLRVVE